MLEWNRWRCRTTEENKTVSRGTAGHLMASVWKVGPGCDSFGVCCCSEVCQRDAREKWRLGSGRQGSALGDESKLGSGSFKIAARPKKRPRQSRELGCFVPSEPTQTMLAAWLNLFEIPTMDSDRNPPMLKGLISQVRKAPIGMAAFQRCPSYLHGRKVDSIPSVSYPLDLGALA